MKFYAAQRRGMTKEKKLNLLGQGLLLAATVVWGSSFFILKEAINSLPWMYVIAVRFLSSAAVLALIFIGRVRKMNKGTAFRGFIIGLALTGAYLAQTLGLNYTTPARNAFITASYCVMCPFLAWGFFRRRPKLYNVIAAVLCIAGIGFVALSGGSGESGENLLLGDALTLLGAVFYALQIIAIDRFSGKSGNADDKMNLIIIELTTVGAIFSVCSLIFELPTKGIAAYAMTGDQLLRIAYLALVCTAFAQSAQLIGQQYASASQSSIILSLEAVFGTLFSVLAGKESLTAWLVIGFVVIFVGMTVSELTPTLMNKRAAGQSKPDLPSENFVGNAEREAENAQSVDKTEEK